MTKKLTGREAVIALMEGKKVRRTGVFNEEQFNNMVSFDPAELKIICTFNDNPDDYDYWQLAHVVQFKDWEIVPEPMVWEGVESVLSHIPISQTHPYSQQYVSVPFRFSGKRVKVRIEEILE